MFNIINTKYSERSELIYNNVLLINIRDTLGLTPSLVKKIKKGNVLVHMSKDNKELEVKDQDPVIKEKVKVKPKILKRVEGSYEREINYRYDGY